MREDLSPIEKRVLRALARADRPIRAIELCRMTRLDQSTIAVYLRRLAARRLVRSSGQRTMRLWRLSDDGRSELGLEDESHSQLSPVSP